MLVRFRGELEPLRELLLELRVDDSLLTEENLVFHAASLVTTQITDYLRPATYIDEDTFWEMSSSVNSLLNGFEQAKRDLVYATAFSLVLDVVCGVTGLEVGKAKWSIKAALPVSGSTVIIFKMEPL